MAKTTKIKKVVTQENVPEGLYKYENGKILVNNVSNIEKQELKNAPNHNIGIRVSTFNSNHTNLTLGADVGLSGISNYYCGITHLNNRFLNNYRVLSKGNSYRFCEITTSNANRLPRRVDSSFFVDNYPTIPSFGYSSSFGNTIQQDACLFYNSVVFGSTFFKSNKSITVPINVSQNAGGKPFCGITYVGEINSGESVYTAIDRMQPSNKTLYHGSLSSDPKYFPEYLPFILIATNKKVDLTTGDEVTFEKYVQIPDAVFEETSAITDRWQRLSGFPSEVNLTKQSVFDSKYAQLGSFADDSGKVHLYGLMLGYGLTVDMVGYVSNYIQLSGNSYLNEAKSNTTRIGGANTTDTYLRGTVHTNGSFVTDSDARIKRKDKLVTTRADGIEVWKFTYHSNGKTELGWIAQQVEEVLRAKSYEQDVIDLAITTEHGVDYIASLSKLNAAMGTSYDLFADAEKAHADWLYGKFTEAGGSEPTLDEFREAIKQIPYESLTEWQKSTMQMLDENALDSFLVWADDIKAINKQVVLDLLGGE